MRWLKRPARQAGAQTTHLELAMVLHADGNGTPGMKVATWEPLSRVLPEGIKMA